MSDILVGYISCKNSPDGSITGTRYRAQGTGESIKPNLAPCALSLAPAVVDSLRIQPDELFYIKMKGVCTHEP